MATIRARRTKNGERRYQVRGQIDQQQIPSATFPTRADARRYAVEIERKIMAGEYFETPPPLSFGQALDGYIARKRSLGRRESTLKDYEEVSVHLESLRELNVKHVRKGIVEEVRDSIGGKRSAQKAVQLVKAVLRDAQSRGHIIDPQVLYVEKPRYESKPRNFLDVEQLKELASWMPGYINRIVLVAGYTGMRRGELLALVDSDLCLSGCKEKAEPHLHIRQAKTNAGRRFIYLGPETVALLRDQLMLRAAGTSLVFPNEHGTKWHPNNFLHLVFRPARKAAGFDSTFHDLRHSYASLLVQAAARKGYGEAITAKVGADALGHKDGGVLFMRLYGHLMKNALPQAAQAVDEIVREAAV